MENEDDNSFSVRSMEAILRDRSSTWTCSNDGGTFGQWRRRLLLLLLLDRLVEDPTDLEEE